MRRHQRWSCRTATYWRPRTPLPRPSRPQRCENRLARAINSGHEGTTIVQNQGARGRSHRRGIPHTRRASHGAWARSQHHLDHTQEELQNLWPVRRHINRMLAAPRLPALVRARILEYIDEKTAGLYGHSNTQLRRFAIRLTVKPANRTRRSGTKVDKEIVNWRSNSISTLHSSSQLQKRPADGLAILNSAHQEF